MRVIKINPKVVYLLIKFFSKCRNDAILFIYGLAAYFISGILTGFIFNDNYKYYFLYPVSPCLLPCIFLYFAGVYTKNKSNFKLLIFGFIWGVTAYISTIMGEYFKNIVNISLLTSFQTAKSAMDDILKQSIGYGGFIGQAVYKFTHLRHGYYLNLFSLTKLPARYAAVYLEMARISTIILLTIFTSNYFLSSKKYINIMKKDISISKEKEISIYYNSGMLVNELPFTLRVNKGLYYIIPFAILPYAAFNFYYSGFDISERHTHFILATIFSAIILVICVLEFRKIKFEFDAMHWHNGINVRKTSLSYKNITKLNIVKDITNSGIKGLIIYSDESRQGYVIETKFFNKEKLSKIIRLISEKSNKVKLDSAAEALKKEKIEFKQMKAGPIINIFMAIIMINIILTVILTI